MFETLHDREAEENLIAGLLVGGTKAIGYAASRLKPEDFWHEAFGKLWGAMLDVHERGTYSLTALLLRLRDKGLSEEIPDDVIHELRGNLYTGASIKAMLERVVSNAERRKLWEASDAIKAAACDRESADYLTKAGAAIEAARRPRPEDNRMAYHDAIAEMDRMAALIKRGARPCVGTGIYSLDDRMVMGQGDLVVVGARTSIGKSALLYQIARHVSTDKPVLFVSCEMDRQGLILRLACTLTGIPVNRFRSATITEDELALATNLLTADLADRKLRHVIQPGANVRFVRDQAMAMAADLGEPIGLVCVDYLQLLAGSNPRMSLYERVSESSSALKRLGIELKCPILAAAQLGRDVEKEGAKKITRSVAGSFEPDDDQTRKARRPCLTDLKDSGQIEQDADTVILIHRDRFCREYSQDCELIVAKHRGGELFDAMVRFIPSKTEFVG